MGKQTAGMGRGGGVLEQARHQPTVGFGQGRTVGHLLLLVCADCHSPSAEAVLLFLVFSGAGTLEV